MSERTFENCLADLKDVTDLQALFKLWRKAHEVEVEAIRTKIKKENKERNCDGKTFQQRIYNESTISSHFIPFFYREKCRECAGIYEETVWQYVLKKAFNEDGCVGTYAIPENGYEYIVLLKEANDSDKNCIKENYVDVEKALPNQWLADWKGPKPGKYNMLYKLNRAFYKFKNGEDKEPGDNDFFFEEMAYMNVNKRGGTSTTARGDENALINYANRYGKFILKEIKLLSKNRKVTVFIGGGEEYFRNLIRELCNKELGDSDKTYLYSFEGQEIRFVNITHPSARKISAKNLAEEMSR